MSQVMAPLPGTVSISGSPVACTAITLIHTVPQGSLHRVIVTGHPATAAGNTFTVYPAQSTVGVSETCEAAKARIIFGGMIDAQTASGDLSVWVDGAAANAKVTCEYHDWFLG